VASPITSGPLWLRSLAAAVVGGLAGSLALIVAVRAAPDLDLDLDRPVPNFTSGFYGPERHDRETFAWTSGEATLVLEGVDRRVPWHCVVRLRSGRPDPSEAPMVEVGLDGVRALLRPATASYQDFTVPVPAAPTRRMALTIASPVFTPASDPRPLGVQVEHLRCAPSAGVMPPPRATLLAALPPALFAVTLAARGLAVWAVLCCVLAVAGLQALVLSLPAVLYSGFAASMVRLALVIGPGALVFQRLAERVSGRVWQPAARAALAVTVSALYLKLAALLQPAKATVDAVFHAHRLEWVLEGRLLFTQPIQDAVLFPYAIGLYVFAAPWTVVTDHHVELLRIIVTAVEVVGGGLLYVLIARHWQDRAAGVLAVALFHLVPIAYAVVGNANLTNAFGQGAALIAIAAATMWRLGRREVGRFVALAALVALAFLSHVSTFALLAVTLGATAALGLWRGRRTFDVPGWPLLLATGTAALVAVLLYYGHFGEVYATARNAGGSTAPDGAPMDVVGLGRRIGRALLQGVSDVGWPMVALAAVGVWRLVVDRARDRLAAAIVGWAFTYVVFTAAGAWSPVNARYERYALEFISRVNLAVYPAVVVLAARGGLWIWRAGVLGRVAAATLIGAAVLIGGRFWLRWLS
jgi:hypothetical protein